mmetsp:Transcript_12845/g.22995  ORF Transcript_12845/g.22995 Transcript_12845/m.22995 type:complete len:180 (+) Transcript_12845:68-607(+)
MAINHPPAAGGKTAWGVKEFESNPGDDPAEIRKLKALQGEFSNRESDRLNRLKEMDKDAVTIMEERRARKAAFDPMNVDKRGDVEAFKKRQLEAFAKMEEMKETKRVTSKAARIAARGEDWEAPPKTKLKKQKEKDKKKKEKEKKKKDKKDKKKKKKEKKKKKKSSSSSDGSSSSSSSS